MLNSIQINHLEKRWQAWRLKQLVSKILIISILLCLIPLIWIVYSYTPALVNNEPIQKKNIAKTQAVEQNKTLPPLVKQTPPNPPKHEELNQTAIVQTKQPNTQEKQLKAEKQKYQEPTFNEEEIIEYVKVQKPQRQIKQEPVLEEEFIELAEDEEYKEKQEQPKKPKIEIKTTTLQETKQTKELKEQNRPDSIEYALMLAEEYYQKKDYKNSQKWSLKANNIDPNNEQSWILFAKSIAKNGKPQRAIRALNAYLKTSPNSSHVISLIGKIKHGDY